MKHDGKTLAEYVQEQEKLHPNYKSILQQYKKDKYHRIIMKNLHKFDSDTQFKIIEQNLSYK